MEFTSNCSAISACLFCTVDKIVVYEVDDWDSVRGLLEKVWYLRS